MSTDNQNKIVLQNAIPEEIALNMRQSFLNADYDKITQERKNYYSREVLNPSPKFPSADEVYTAEFYRSNYLEKSEFVKDCFHRYIKPVVEQHTGFNVSSADLRAYKMLEGGHFRVHKDDWMATKGFVWYLSKEWRWDWGGLLVDLDKEDDSQASVTIPTFNQLVIMNHQSELPHLVTPVTACAREPRLMLVGFLN